MDKKLYAILNKRIKSGGGSGGTSVYVQNCTINSDGNLIITLSDGSTINAGRARGNDGTSPTISINEIENGVEILIDGVSVAEIYNGLPGEKGEPGVQGEQGLPGNDGVSPTIEIYANTSSTYQLKINNADGSSFITPNLRGTGGATTRYNVFDNALYTNYVDTIYTVFNGTLKSISDYIAAGSSFCSETNNYALSYNTTDFGWNGTATSFNVTPMTIESGQLLLYGYIANSLKSGEYIKLIPSGLVSGSTNLEKAQSIQALLADNNSSIISIDFEFVYAVNGVTEAVSLDSVPAGEYYVCWTATSDNSSPKINDITIV